MKSVKQFEKYETALKDIAEMVKLDAFAFNELAANVYEKVLNTLDKEEI